MYSAMLQDPSRSSTLVLKTSSSPETLGSLVRAEVQKLDAELPVYAVRSMRETIDLTSDVAVRRLVLYLVGAFSSMGGMSVHEWVHDARHLLGFPCH